jgi:hypothetical protein
VTDLDSFGGMDLWTIGIFTLTLPDFADSEPWGDAGFLPAPISWQFVDHIMKYLVARDPGFNIRDFDVSTAGVVGDKALAFFDSRTEAGDGDVPQDLLQFIRTGKKLLIYHGYSDPALPPFRTITYDRNLAELVAADTTSSRTACGCSWCRACSTAAAGPGRTRSTRCRRWTPG